MVDKDPRLFSRFDELTLNDAETLKDVDKLGLVALRADEGPAADVDSEDEGGGPGRAGKSSLDIVNSLVSMAGCFTIPTEKEKTRPVKTRQNLEPPSGKSWYPPHSLGVNLLLGGDSQLKTQKRNKNKLNVVSP